MNDPAATAPRVFAVCRPLVANVPVPPAAGSDWKQVACERCGAPCWERPSEEARLRNTNLVRWVPCCTLCALQRGLTHHA